VSTLEISTSIGVPSFDEYMLATAFYGLQCIARRPWYPLEVWLRGGDEAESRAAFFGCPVHLGAELNAFAFARAVLSIETASPDDVLHAVLLRQLEAMRRDLGESGSFSSHAEAIVARELSTGRLDIDAVAKKLAVSRRTLQRRLDEDGDSFSDLVERVRRRLAEVYLAESEVKVAEVARRLGYADPRAFHRAYKRWTAKTPSERRDKRS
jgi:AraC-like DNA-binding protein